MFNKYYLYWIHRPCHNNINKEGYIGITKQPSRRFFEHKCDAYNRPKTIIHHALNKYDDCMFNVLCIGSKKYIANLEYKLRPTSCIGWSISVGGEITMRNYQFTKKDRDKISDSLCQIALIDVFNIWFDWFEKAYKIDEIVDKYLISKTHAYRIISCKGNRLLRYSLLYTTFRENSLRKSNKISEDIYDRILYLRESGKELQEIADAFGIAKSSVKRYCNGDVKYTENFKNYRVVQGSSGTGTTQDGGGAVSTNNMENTDISKNLVFEYEDDNQITLVDTKTGIPIFIDK
jgi:hypothetical protein